MFFTNRRKKQTQTSRPKQEETTLQSRAPEPRLTSDVEVTQQGLYQELVGNLPDYEKLHFYRQVETTVLLYIQRIFQLAIPYLTLALSQSQKGEGDFYTLVRILWCIIFLFYNTGGESPSSTTLFLITNVE